MCGRVETGQAEKLRNGKRKGSGLLGHPLAHGFFFPNIILAVWIWTIVDTITSIARRHAAAYHKAGGRVETSENVTNVRARPGSRLCWCFVVPFFSSAVQHGLTEKRILASELLLLRNVDDSDKRSRPVLAPNVPDDCTIASQ